MSEGTHGDDELAEVLVWLADEVLGLGELAGVISEAMDAGQECPQPRPHLRLV
jgi:hypothetical protein